MARQQVIHIHSSVFSNNVPKAPNASVLGYGEIAVNYNATEPSLFVRDANDAIRQFHTSDVILSKAKLGPNFTIHEEVDDDSLLQITGDDSVVSSIGKIMRIIMDNEKVSATALNDLNLRVTAFDEELDEIAKNSKVSEDYTPVEFAELPTQKYVFEAVTANDTLTDAVSKIDLNFSQLLNATLENEEICANSLNDLNKRLDNVKVSIDSDYTPVVYNSLPGDDVTFDPVIANDTLTDAAGKLDTSISKLVDVVLENEEICAQAFNDLNKKIDDISSNIKVDVDVIVSDDYISVEYPKLDGSDLVFNPVKAGDDLTSAVHKIDTNIAQLLEVSSENEFVVAEALNILNDKLNSTLTDIDNINDSLKNISASVDSNYESVEYPVIPEVSFDSVVAGDTLTDAAGKLDSNISKVAELLSELENDVNNIPTLTGSTFIRVQNNTISALTGTTNTTLAVGNHTHSEFNTINTGINTLQGNITTINTNVAEVQGSVNTLNTTVGGLQGNITTINNNITELSNELTVVSEKVDNVKVSVDVDYVAPEYMSVPGDKYLFYPIEANDTLTDVVSKVDNNFSEFLRATHDSELIVSSSLNDLNERVTNVEQGGSAYLEGVNVVTTLTSVPIDKRLVTCEISTSGSFSLAEVPAAGRELRIMVKARGTEASVIALPTASSYYVMHSDTLSIDPGVIAEINCISDGNKVYVRIFHEQGEK